MKKLLLIALVTVGLLVAAAPKSEARVFVNIGVGLPIAYYPSPGYYGYAPYPYAYGGYYPSAYAGYGYRPYYWWHGRRIYYRRHCW